MADTPTEGEAEPAPAKRGRKPRATTASATPAVKATRAAKAAVPAAKTAVPAATEAVKRTTRAAVKKAEGAAKTARKKAEKVATPSTVRRVAVGAVAVAGVAAGVAAAISNRKKIVRAASDAIDAVKGAASGVPEADKPFDPITPGADYSIPE